MNIGRALDVSSRLKKIRVPALHISGWYDMFLRGSVDGFFALRKSAGSEFARETSILACRALGAYSVGRPDRDGGLGPEALVDTDTILLRWFDHWLKDSARLPEKRTYAISCSEKIAGVKRKFFLSRPNMRCISTARAGRIRAKEMERCRSVIPRADEPATFSSTILKCLSSRPGGPAASAAHSIRPHWSWGTTCSFIRQSRSKSRYGFSVFRASSLYCATSIGNADFTAKLVRATPNGAAEFICIGIARSNCLFAGTKYVADKIHRWEFFLEPTSCRFDRGDRIRLEIASSAFPLFDRNPGSEVPSCRATSWDWRRSTQSVFHGRVCPSALYLPVSEAPE